MMRLQVLRWLGSLLMIASWQAWAADLQPGRDYVQLQPTQPTTQRDKVVVTEFFSYQCPHCYSFFPALTRWAAKLPKDVVFEREAVSIGYKAWVPAAQTFYTLRAMGRVEALDGAIFAAIHRQRVKFTDRDAIGAWVAKQGINAQQFAATYDSFGVKAATAGGDRLAANHKVSGIPTLVIDGMYVVGINDVPDFSPQLAVVDQLIAKARAAKARR